MKNENRNEEPFKPERTPTPPQSMRPDERQNERTSAGKKQEDKSKSNQPSSKSNEHLLNEDADIHDETTI
jgi:hypothetical protein